MGRESHTTLGPLGRRALLGFSATIPLDSEPAPTVTIMFGGEVIDRFVPKRRDVERSYIVQSRSGAAEELVILVDQAINPARMHHGADTRDLALQLHVLTWKRR